MRSYPARICDLTHFVRGIDLERIQRREILAAKLIEQILADLDEDCTAPSA